MESEIKGNLQRAAGMGFNGMFSEELDDLKTRGLYRSISERGGAQGRTIVISDREYLNFASNDYLGLAGDERICAPARSAIHQYGMGSGASRLLGGGTQIHSECERTASRLKSTEAALLFGSGYSANTGAIPALAGAGDAIFSDELNHASLIDGCRLSSADVHIYRHRDADHLAQLLGSVRARRKVVITDTVFSMTGAIAPLRDIYALCDQHGSMLYLDDAHGTGVLGMGRGGLTHFGLKPESWVVQMATCSKALGAEGAFVAGYTGMINWLINNARSFIYSTAPPACTAAAASASMDILMGPEGEALVRRLWTNQRMLTEALLKAGIKAANTETPIIPLTVGDLAETLSISAGLMARGIYAPAIRPPTVPSPIIRITVTALHTPDDIEALVAGLGQDI